MAIGNLWYNDFHLPTLPLPAIELDASTSDIKIHSDRQLVQKKIIFWKQKIYLNDH